MVADDSQLLNNEEFLEVASLCQSYVNLQEKLAYKLAKGTFSLATDRKYNKIPLSINRVMDAGINLDCTEQGFELFHSKVEFDPLLLLNALPSPALKSAKTAFVSSITDIIELANIAMKLQNYVVRVGLVYRDDLSEIASADDELSVGESEVSDLVKELGDCARS